MVQENLMDVNKAVAVVSVIQETTAILQHGYSAFVFAYWGPLSVFVLYVSWGTLY